MGGFQGSTGRFRETGSCHTGHPSTRSVLCSLVPFGGNPFLTAHTRHAKLPDTQKSKIQGLQDESGESINEERKNSQPGNHEETQKITELGFTLLLNSPAMRSSAPLP